jgi:hypothetical protein
MRLRVVRIFASDGTTWPFMFVVEAPEEPDDDGISCEFAPTNPAAPPELPV